MHISVVIEFSRDIKRYLVVLFSEFVFYSFVTYNRLFILSCWINVNNPSRSWLELSKAIELTVFE